jgi:hypothetical protein
MKATNSPKKKSAMASVKAKVKKIVHEVDAVSPFRKMVSDKNYILEQIKKSNPLDKNELKKRGIKLAKAV